MPKALNCPNCGGEVVPPVPSARVASCPYCESTLVVNEEAVRALGKMALLTDPPSCLAVGWRAKCLRHEIQVLGRLQLRYKDGVWDEWWIQSIDDGSYAWISQDEGVYMFEKPVENPPDLPDFDSVSPGDTVQIGKYSLQVEEKNVAEMAGVQGQLPVGAAPEGKMRFLELANDRVKCTIEYFEDGSREMFVGRMLKPNDLVALPHDGASGSPSPYSAPLLTRPPDLGRDVIGAAASAEARALSCPSCGGTVEVKDPGKAAMIVCIHCGSALDVTVEGLPKLLYKSEERKVWFPIETGARCTIRGGEYTVIGRVRYSSEGDSWTDLQLFSPQKGYAFLEYYNGHWTFSKTLSSPVSFDPKWSSQKDKFTYKGQRFVVYEKSFARIAYVEGELTWVARLHDHVEYMDAICPPYIISAEWTENELEWTYGSYMYREEVAEAFSMKLGDLPMPGGIGAAQPFKIDPSARRAKWIGLVATVAMVACAVMAYMASSGSGKVLLQDTITEAYLTEAGWLSKPFTIPEGSHICKLTVQNGSINNTWAAMTIAFLDENDNVLLDTDASLEYYHGVEGGESWSEGSRKDTTLLRLEGPREYRLIVFGEEERRGVGVGTQVQLRAGITPSRYFLIAACLVFLYPMAQFIRQGAHEGRRWAPVTESDDD